MKLTRTLVLSALMVMGSSVVLPVRAQDGTGSGASAATTSDDAASRQQEESQTQQKLQALREEIRALAEQQKATEAQKGGVVAELREREVRIAAVAKEVRSLDARLGEQQAALAVSQQQRGELEQKLNVQRDALATLLRSAYALGRHEELKLILQQDEVSTASRVLAYHRYFQRARIDRIRQLLVDLADLARVQQMIEAQTAAIVATRTERATETSTLQRERVERQALIDQLDLTLKGQAERIAALGKDEKALVELLERLRDVFADIPKQLAGAEPFADRRGRLAWPVTGKISTGFGAVDDSGRAITGIVIAAGNGTEIRAVARGRVAYADWLKGYGLLVILDHGDGYMSLYGYNETLLKDVGDWVDAGEAIATAGASGGRKATGLYFELRNRGKPLDPRAWLKTASN
ncbi:murein hydrolase activator EnvC family protein [Tahibacter amnicola]|uniref:Peptidoglycan DD-metalloendopeptidase family protein n=1 Tax=Tahibacter amnicola TaxID=2976241 RepID=A0ABY6BG95_9GAMM|nr:peptidoglycan DD-metalloendopeptidase family protein [Tahibacter amnicola]UXI68626.1 peptidoglycan DD-metalloendopeptidase family protein [Tahibacter amnicola]